MGRGELSCQKWRKTRTLAFPSQRKRSLEVVERRLKGFVGGEFIDSLSGIDELRNNELRNNELRNRRRSLEVRYAVRPSSGRGLEPS